MSPVLWEEMVQVALLLTELHPKRQKGAEQIFLLQELKPPHILSGCQGVCGRDGQAPPCATCPRPKQQHSMHGSGPRLG